MIVRRIIVTILTYYKRWISPALPGACRFYPTCSSYAAQAIEKYGVMSGLRMAIVRLMHCHPWNPGGYDPVP